MDAGIVEVSGGRLRGLVSSDGRVRSFRGVPYAKPPVGELRWRPPVSPDRWEGERPAVAFGSCAPQPQVEDAIGGVPFAPQGEDCLTLNVWTAATDPDERRPVMVWIHYGAFFFGSGSIPLFDGEALARSGVVVVTVNHRLGPLGFLAHPALSEESPTGTSGNYGLLDQIKALGWLQENIDAFGGDPNCVTVFGLSAGSMSVSLLMATPLARGLFHRAIGQSGGTFGPVGASTGISDSLQHLQGAEEAGESLARGLGARSASELRACSVDEILSTEVDAPAEAWRFGDAPFRRGAFDCGFPIVDGTVVPESPYVTFREGRQAQVPLITGSAAGEATGMPYMPTRTDFLADARLEYGPEVDEFLALYPAPDDDAARAVSAQANGDRVFVWQNWTWARLHAETSAAPTFYYHVSNVPPVDPLDPLAPPMGHAYHGGEVAYVFGTFAARPWSWSDADRLLGETIAGYWTTFARTGDPNGDDRPTWPRFDPANPAAFHFREVSGLAPVPQRARLEFWERFFVARHAASASIRGPDA